MIMVYIELIHIRHTSYAVMTKTDLMQSRKYSLAIYFSNKNLYT